MPETAIDREHPGYLRDCIRPDCAATFNILDVMEGQPGHATGWHHAPRIFQGYLCPDHSAAASEHRPEWVLVNGQVTGCECECTRWMWLPSTPVTLGEYQERYAGHLVAVDISRALLSEGGQDD